MRNRDLAINVAAVWHKIPDIQGRMRNQNAISPRRLSSFIESHAQSSLARDLLKWDYKVLVCGCNEPYLVGLSIRVP